MSEEREAKPTGRPKRISADEHGPFLRLSIVELVVGLLAIVGAILGGYAFLWSEIKELRKDLSTLSEGDVRIKADYDHMGKDLHQTQYRLQEWYKQVFTDNCRFHGGEYIPNEFVCEFKDGRAALPFRGTDLLPPP